MLKFRFIAGSATPEVAVCWKDGRKRRERNKRKKRGLVLKFRVVADSTEPAAAGCWPGGRAIKKKRKRKQDER